MKQKDPEWYSPKDVAALLNVDPKTVRTWIHRGTLKATKIETRFFIKSEDLNELLKRNKAL